MLVDSARLPFTCFHALKLQQLPSRIQKCDLLTFQSLDHHCNGWADSTWRSWPVEPLAEGPLNVSCAVCEDFWRLRSSAEAMCSHARSDLLMPISSFSSTSVSINKLTNTKKNHKKVYNLPNLVFTHIIFYYHRELVAVFHLSQNTVKCVFVQKHDSRKVSLKVQLAHKQGKQA